MKITTVDQFIKWIEFNGWVKSYTVQEVVRYNKRDISITISMSEPQRIHVDLCVYTSSDNITHSDIANEIVPFMKRNIHGLKDLPTESGLAAQLKDKIFIYNDDYNCYEKTFKSGQYMRVFIEDDAVQVFVLDGKGYNLALHTFKPSEHFAILNCINEFTIRYIRS